MIKIVNIRRCLLPGLIILTVFSSCKKWLDVTPQTQIKEGEQFSSQQGFTDALFGTYTLAASDSLYGNSLSFGMLDVLAQYYENKASTTTWYGPMARYMYTSASTGGTLSVVVKVNNIWGGMYNAIAQANYILKNVDVHKDVLKGDAYNIVKGEALALRAFMHFDLLRMFAPAWLDGANAQRTAIPYMEQFTVIPQEKKTVIEILNKCEQELLGAQSLLAVNTNIDQIASNQGSTSLDLFLMYRQNHLNYWAVKGTLARLYLYKGDKVNALKYAKEVIESGKFSLIKSTELSTDPTSITSDLTFTKEHIFSVYVAGLKTVTDNLFKQAGTSAETTDLFSTRAKLDALYEATVTGYGSDIRRVDIGRLWQQVTTAVVYSKKFYADNPGNVRQRLIPNMRLPEMYFIAAEASAAPADGVVFLNAVRTARLLPALDASISAATLDAEIQKEFRKEMYGEGQAFFFYKRKNIVNIPDGVVNPMSEVKYVFPFPDNELEFGK